MFCGSERGHQLLMYATGGGMEDHTKCVQLGKGGGMPCLIYTYALTLSHFLFSATFLTYSVVFYLFSLIFKLIFIPKRYVCQKWLFFSNDINLCCHEISFF